MNKRPLRILHFADYHLGLTIGPQDPETRLNGRVADFLDVFDSLIEFADENSADAVLFSGDAFHYHSPSPTLLKLFGERVARLAKRRPVILIPGNHDLPGSADKSSAVDVFGAVHAPNVHIGLDYNNIVIDTERGKFQVSTLPYPLKSRFVTMKDKKDDTNTLLRNRFRTVIRGLASQLDPSLPSIAMGHFTVEGCKFGSEREMIMGVDSEVMLKDLMYWNYVALGHIHYRQDVTDDPSMPPVVYPGSLERINFGEEKERKGFVWLELSTDALNYEFVDVDARPYRTIRVNISGSKYPNEVILNKLAKLDVKGAILRFIIDAGESDKAIIAETIHEQARLAGAYYVQSVQVIRARKSRVDLGGELAFSMPPRKLIDAYLTSLDIKDTTKCNLLKLADDIMAEVAEEYNG